GVPTRVKGACCLKIRPLPTPPSATHPNGLLAEAYGPCHIATHGAVARRSPARPPSPRPHGPPPPPDRRRGKGAPPRCAPLPTPPSATHPNGLLAEAYGPCHIATHGAVARRSPARHRSPRAHGSPPHRDGRRGRAALRRRAPRPTRAPLPRKRRRAHPQRPAAAHQRRRVGHPR